MLKSIVSFSIELLEIPQWDKTKFKSFKSYLPAPQSDEEFICFTTIASFAFVRFLLINKRLGSINRTSTSHLK